MAPSLEKEVDLRLLEENLELSYEERIEQHQQMLDLIDELHQIGRENRDTRFTP